jgi:hypothetical protein
MGFHYRAVSSLSERSRQTAPQLIAEYESRTAGTASIAADFQAQRAHRVAVIAINAVTIGNPAG